MSHGSIKRRISLGIWKRWTFENSSHCIYLYCFYNKSHWMIMILMIIQCSNSWCYGGGDGCDDDDENDDECCNLNDDDDTPISIIIPCTKSCCDSDGEDNGGCGSDNLVLVLTISNEGPYLLFKSIFHKALN